MNHECSINDKDLYAQTSKEDPAPIRFSWQRSILGWACEWFGKTEFFINAYKLQKHTLDRNSDIQGRSRTNTILLAESILGWACEWFGKTEFFISVSYQTQRTRNNRLFVSGQHIIIHIRISRSARCHVHHSNRLLNRKT